MSAGQRRPRRLEVSMLLPEANLASGDVDGRAHIGDVRVPTAFFGHDAGLISSWDRNEPCPDGRHLWDALIAHGEARYDDDHVEHVPFRLRLTCVRCGRIEQLAGVSDERECRQLGRVPVEPLAAGGLRAQQITPEDRFALSEWTVHDASGARVGRMSAGITRRRRRYVAGRLDGGEAVEGATAIACLRKLARTGEAVGA